MAIIITDDHDLFREGLVMIFKQQQLDENLYQANDAKAALKIVNTHEKTQNGQDETILLLIDIEAATAASEETAKHLRDHSATLKIIILFGGFSDPKLRQAMVWKPVGMIPKSLPADVMIKALDLIRLGGTYAPLQLISTMSRPGGAIELISPRTKPFDRLTRRQNEILSMLGRGLTNAQISAETKISEGTVRIHVSAVLHALNVPTRTHAALMAQQAAIQLLRHTDHDALPMPEPCPPFVRKAG